MRKGHIVSAGSLRLSLEAKVKVKVKLLFSAPSAGIAEICKR